jgi:hypothetical protein
MNDPIRFILSLLADTTPGEGMAKKALANSRS